MDRTFNLIRIDRPDGSPIALVANYAMHGTVMGGAMGVEGCAHIVNAYDDKKISEAERAASFMLPGGIGILNPGLAYTFGLLGLSQTTASMTAAHSAPSRFVAPRRTGVRDG